MPVDPSDPAPDLRALTRAFARIGCLSFGGPAAQIALMHGELVAARRWLTERQFANALSFCMMLPGPEAMQLATYAGWRLHGIRGGLVAGGLFVLPGALVILVLAVVYAAFGQVPLVRALFLGVQAAVLAIVAQALLRLAGRALEGAAHWWLAGLAFAGLFLFDLPFPLVIALAALYGLLTSGADAGTAAPLPAAAHGRTLPVVALWSGIWLVPLAALWLFEGGLLARIGSFFAQLAVVSFGGAYAVLAWMTQTVVQEQGWLTTTQMIDALGLAETTPGPLILVTEFVAYLAGAQAGGAWLGAAAALVALWATFVPCFLWIFAGAPHIERLAAQPRLSGALRAVTAAVVGVMASLALWFAAHVLFAEIETRRLGPLRLLQPEAASFVPEAFVLALAAGLALIWRGWPLLPVLGGAALAGGVLGAV